MAAENAMSFLDSARALGSNAMDAVNGAYQGVILSWGTMAQDSRLLVIAALSFVAFVLVWLFVSSISKSRRIKRLARVLEQATVKPTPAPRVVSREVWDRQVARRHSTAGETSHG